MSYVIIEQSMIHSKLMDDSCCFVLFQDISNAITRLNVYSLDLKAPMKQNFDEN